ncbi:MAG: protein-glutamate O-methyltransferase CheR [Firmicutes bacterium]|nr:protein-glutamate O-methyltransferase CheR [Bacillota bacterium]
MSEPSSEIIAVLSAKSRVDLKQYNVPQLRRRLALLRVKFGFNSMDEYLAALKTDSSLVEATIQRLTIVYTGFFRDKRYWLNLQQAVAELELVNSGVLKFWSCGCATGEEAYSLAFMLATLLPTHRYQIYASDVDKQALAHARAGLYPSKAVQEIGVAERSRWFKQKEDGFQVREQFRKRIQFFSHDLHSSHYLQDNHMIICRNVIIHFNEAAKAKIHQKLAAALVQNGYLFLGATEQILSPEHYNLKPESLYLYKKL